AMAGGGRVPAAGSPGRAGKVGCRAGAWPGGRPGASPRCAAAASTASRSSRLPRLPKTTRGEGASRHSRATRSVESRSSHRLRMRCELETLLHTVPLHDPCSKMTTAVAHEPREKPQRTDAVTALSIEGRRRADDPARGGGGRPIVRRGAQDEAERVAGGGRGGEPARRPPIHGAGAPPPRPPPA